MSRREKRQPGARRLTDPSPRRQVRAAPNREAERRIANALRVRLLGRWGLWILTTGVVTLWWGMSVDAAWTVDRAVSAGETERTPVTRIVDEDDWTETYVEVDGDEYLVEDTPPTWTLTQAARVLGSATEYEVGQEIEVALSPDSELGWAYDVTRYGSFAWPGALLGLLFMNGAMALLRGVVTRHWVLPDSARWQWWWTRRSTLITVVEVRTIQHRFPPLRHLHTATDAVVAHFTESSPLIDHHLVVERPDGRRFFWEARSEPDIHVTVGTIIRVVGRVRHGGWIVALTDRDLYPADRLD